MGREIMAYQLVAAFKSEFELTGGRRLAAVRAPGRTEIAGNHTDHEGGHVIGSAVDAYVEGVAAANKAERVRVLSEGYPAFEVDLGALGVDEAAFGTSAALVRGLAALFAERGVEPKGFDLYLRSGVPAGSGLSSSAAFELAVAQTMNLLWAEGALSPAELAIMGQAAENRWFGKPCGLLDQASSALGGIQHMDFSVAGRLAAEALDFDFGAAGYAVCLVEVGADHAALTSEYAAVPAEMQAVASELGVERLGELHESDVFESFGTLRERLGDRPVLRALHYFREERLVEERAAALRAGDMVRFLGLTRASGASSAMYLQNVSVAGAEAQPTMVVLALAEELAGERGAVRIHGGGFGGTIQAFVPLDVVGTFTVAMNAALGCSYTLAQEPPADAPCKVYGIDHEGARAWWL